MKFLRGKRAVFPLVGVIVVVAVAFGFWQNSQPWIPEGWTAPLTPPPAYAQTGGSTVELKGWAWSSNIGWVSFNCNNLGPCSEGNDYKVTVDTTTGEMSGYAWSNHIGWISFQETSGFPSAPLQRAKLSITDTDKKLVGWARAIVGTSPESAGWDGWISLSGLVPNTNPQESFGVVYDTASGRFEGSAWGSNVVGWLKFGLELNAGGPCPTGVCLPPTGGGSLTMSCSYAIGSDTTYTPGTNISVLSGQTVKLKAAPSGGASPYSYSWTGTLPGTASGQDFTSSAITSNGDKTVNVTDSSVFAKTGSCNFTVTVRPQRTLKVVVQNNTAAALSVTGSEDFGGISNCTGTCTKSVSVGDAGTLTLGGVVPAGANVSWTSTEPLGSSCTSGATCTTAVPNGSGDFTITVTIGSASSCPVSIRCTKQSPGYPSCLASAGTESPLILDTTSISSPNLTVPAAKIEIINSAGEVIPGASLSMNFVENTIDSSLCTPGISVSGNHRFSSASSMSSPIEIANRTMYTLSSGSIYYKMVLPISGSGDIAYQCLTDGRKIVEIQLTAPSCPTVRSTSDIIVEYISREISQKSKTTQ